MAASEALSWLTSAPATSSLKRCRPRMCSSSVPRTSSRYTATDRRCPSRCARSIACAHPQTRLTPLTHRAVLAAGCISGCVGHVRSLYMHSFFTRSRHVVDQDAQSACGGGMAHWKQV